MPKGTKKEAQRSVAASIEDENPFIYLTTALRRFSYRSYYIRKEPQQVGAGIRLQRAAPFSQFLADVITNGQVHLFDVNSLELTQAPELEEVLQSLYACCLKTFPAGIAREAKALALVKQNFVDWQEKGYIPSSQIPRGGDKTEEPIRTRGWTHWHHLFTPRQLFMLGSFAKNAVMPAATDALRVGVAAVGIGAAADYLSRLCGINPHFSKGPGSTRNVFFNQALSPQVSYASRPLDGIKDFLCADFTAAPLASSAASVTLTDAREVIVDSDIWFTDPPYADAVKYHELTDYFLAWYERLLPTAFKEWRFQDVTALSVQGSGDDFKRSMVDIYARLARQMPDSGLQLVQFTHQNPAVWGDLGMILWASGLKPRCQLFLMRSTRTPHTRPQNMP